MKTDAARKKIRQEARNRSAASGASSSPGTSSRASPISASGNDTTSISNANNANANAHSLVASVYDFSASAFEFSPVTPDTTDRLTHQHDALEPFASLASPPPSHSSYLDTLNLQYPSSHRSPSHSRHSFDLETSLEQAFEQGGPKRRRVSPDYDMGQALTSSETSSIIGPSEVSTDSYGGGASPGFDAFTSYFPYSFNFNHSTWIHPPLLPPYHEENELLIPDPALIPTDDMKPSLP